MLTARAGLWSDAQYRDSLASIAAAMSYRTGRSWRSLQDTADAAPLTYFGGGGWANWRRGTDFYPEGQLLWLDVDTQIRELSHGKHSLDDFAHAFYGMDSGSYVTKTYTFDDVIHTLNQVQPYDWATFLRARLDYTGDTLPEQGIERGGWKLVFTDQPNDRDKAMEKMRHGVNLAYSLGLSAGSNGHIYDVQWNGPAFKAGLVPGLDIVAVNGKDFSADALKDAVTAGQGRPGADRAAGEEPGRLQHLQGRLPRRPEVPAPGPRQGQGPDRRDRRRTQVIHLAPPAPWCRCANPFPCIEEMPF